MDVDGSGLWSSEAETHELQATGNEAVEDQLAGLGLVFFGRVYFFGQPLRRGRPDPILR